MRTITLLLFALLCACPTLTQRDGETDEAFQERKRLAKIENRETAWLAVDLAVTVAHGEGWMSDEDLAEWKATIKPGIEAGLAAWRAGTDEGGGFNAALKIATAWYAARVEAKPSD